MVKHLLAKVLKEPCLVTRTVDDMTVTEVERNGGTTIDLADVAPDPNLAQTPHPIAIVATTEIAIIVDTTIVMVEITDVIVIAKAATETETMTGAAMHKLKAQEIGAIPNTIVIDLMKIVPHRVAPTIKLRSLHST